MAGSPQRQPGVRRRSSGSVRARLIRLALLMMLPGLTISAVLIWRVYTTERDGTETALRETALGLSQVLDRELAQSEVFLRTLAATDELQSGNLAAFDRLARATEVMGGNVVLLDRAGHRLVDTGSPAGTPSQGLTPSQDWDAEQPGRFSAQSLQPPPGGGQPKIQLALPLGDLSDGKAGRHVYDLKLLVPPQSIQAVITREKLPPGWIASVLDTGHIIVARTAAPELFIGQRARPGFLESLSKNSEGFSNTSSLDGTPVLVAYTTSARTGWVVSVAAPRALIARVGLQSTWLFIWMGSVAVLIDWLFALHVARGIAKRIEAVASAARQLGETEQVKPILRGLDEADAVADALEAAAAALVERREAWSDLNATLALRVEARTTELAQANTALDDQRRQLDAILDHMPVGVVVHRADGKLVFANTEARRLLALPPAGDITEGQWPPLRRGPLPLPPAEQPWTQAATGLSVERALLNLARPDGAQTDLEINASPLQRAGDGTVMLSITTLQDVTARLEAEEARRRSQRLEAIGQLTGGVAHEFNNLLMAISGCLELLEPFVQVGRGPRLRANALRATTRGGRLTRQLLAFSRRQHLQPESVDLNALVAGMAELLESTLGRGVEVTTELQEGAWPAMADVPQIELVLLNLAINARDAMAGGGRLTIRTGCARTGPPTRAEDPPAGEYAVLDVSDTGTGMPAQVLARAFEPFFTTKEVGLGSGLGLPQVLGVAQQLGGGVAITSHPGQGTNIRVYLPRAFGPPGSSARPEKPAASAEMLSGTRLLLVDDDSDVREIAREMLEEMGATVSDAENAAAAMLRLRTGGDIDLVLADLTMPQTTGIELAREIAIILPDLPVVLMTGYGASAMVDQGPNIRGTLQKPFRADTLGKLLAGLLGKEEVVG
jgi:PAS domain S-box-containing protein